MGNQDTEIGRYMTMLQGNSQNFASGLYRNVDTSRLALEAMTKLHDDQWSLGNPGFEYSILPAFSEQTIAWNDTVNADTIKSKLAITFPKNAYS